MWQDFLTQLYTNFTLPQQLAKLIQVLVARRRVELLPAVIIAILQEFWRRKHIVHFEVTSSQELALPLQAAVVEFLIKQVGSVVKATFEIDDTLICGIKMRSDSYMFEHSIARELKKFEESLLQRVRL